MLRVAWSVRSPSLNRGAPPLGLPCIRLRAKRYGETSPKLEERPAGSVRVGRFASLAPLFRSAGDEIISSLA
jgi:hypothetical protein